MVPVDNFVHMCLDRYKNLPGEENQMSFVNIQLDLVYFFTASLDEIKSECGGPLTACFLFIMNSTNYLATILQDWSEQPVSQERGWTLASRSGGMQDCLSKSKRDLMIGTYPFSKSRRGMYTCTPPLPSSPSKSTPELRGYISMTKFSSVLLEVHIAFLSNNIFYHHRFFLNSTTLKHNWLRRKGAKKVKTCQKTLTLRTMILKLSLLAMMTLVTVGRYLKKPSISFTHYRVI